MREGGRKAGLRLYAAIAVLFLLGLFLPSLEAGVERYDYDGLGRLIRVIDEQGRVTEYQYDAAGNILRVITGSEQALPPSISGITPTTLRRGETRTVTITGSGLTAVAVGTVDPGLSIFDTQSSSEQVTFGLAVSEAASLGTHDLSLTSAAGSAAASITVAPKLPKLLVDPTPLAIPPDSVARPIKVRLSNADTIDHVVSLSASNPNITVAPAQITFAAGETSASATVTGVTAGQANLQLTSATLVSTSVPVFITAEFKGISTSYARSLGVVLESATPPGTSTPSLVASTVLGVVVGRHVSDVSPNALVVGGGTAEVSVTGAGLDQAASVSIVPADGVTVGALSPAADGRSLSVPLTVTSEAPLGARQVIVRDSGGAAFPVSRPDVDRIAVVRPAPELDSIEPLFTTRGTTVTLVLRGRNLQDMQAHLIPSTGMTVGNDPIVNASGTEARVRLAVGVTAALGEYALIVTNPGGSSDSAPSPYNTFRVVSEIEDAIKPVLSAAVGVVLESNAVSPDVSTGVFSRLLGVSVGSVVRNVSPSKGIVGTAVTLSLGGHGLAEVSSVELVPATGVTIGAVAPAADGKSVAVELAIASDAPETVRRIKVLAGTVEVPFGDPAKSQFKVTAPEPVIESVTPIVVKKGEAPQSILIRGKNLQETFEVLVLPPAGISVSLPGYKTDGTEVTASISADTTAATGTHVVTVITPAGQSSTVAVPANALSVVDELGPSLSPIVSPAVGVMMMSAEAAQETPVGPVLAPSLGVVLESGELVPNPRRLAASPVLGVAIGPVGTRIEPAGFAPATSGILTVHGAGLDAVSAITITPSDGVTVGTIAATADGTSLTVPLTIAADAQPLVPRGVSLQGAQGAIPFAPGASPLFVVGPGTPRLDSITPILATQGDKITMTIRGARLSGATAVTATPPQGITIANVLSVNAQGTELVVELAIAPDAPLGSRVIRVWVPGAGSTDEAVPANTFTVYPQ